MPTTPPRGVVLDLGNVLIDWDPVSAVAEGVGVEAAHEFLTAEDFDFHAWNHGPDSGGTWAEALALVERDYPHWLDHAQSYVEHFGLSLRGEVPGSGDVVRDLHAAGVPLWGLTNWSAELYPQAPERFELLGLLRDVVVSGTEGAAKPDPLIFRILERRLGVPLTELVFVDDREVNVEIAGAMGMDAVLFTDAATLRTQLTARGLLPAPPASH